MLWNEWKRGLGASDCRDERDEVERIASSDAACIEAAPDPGDRTAGRNADRRFDRQRGKPSVKGRVCSLDVDWANRSNILTGGKAKLYADQQAQLLSAQDPVHGARAVCAAIETRPPRDGHMDNGTGDGAPRNVLIVAMANAGADRVGGPFKRSETTDYSECDGSITGPHQVLPPRSAMDK